MENNGIGKLFEGVDRWTVLIYVLIVLVGFVAILSASYEEGAESIFSFSHFYMKQLVWMGISFAVAVVVLLVDASIYHKWAYLFYVLGLLTLVAALLFGREVNGAKAWFEIGSVRIQPVEFAKIATALALARVMSSSSFSINRAGGSFQGGIGDLSAAVDYRHAERYRIGYRARIAAVRVVPRRFEQVALYSGDPDRRTLYFFRSSLRR